jgi:4-hydroxy-3-methylbut-2-enyl diphosphate reductase IspH
VPRSFCAGVDRPFEIVERLLEFHGAPTCARQHIVHSGHVVRRLERVRAAFVESEDEAHPGRSCVLSAPEVALAVRENGER